MLFIRFGTILALSVGVGIVGEVRFERIERDVDDDTRSFIETERDLATVRNCVLESRIRLRDLLRSMKPESDALYLAQVTQTDVSSDAAFARNHGRGLHVGSDAIAEFERPVGEHRTSVGSIVSLGLTAATSDPTPVLQQRIGPKRDVILQIAKHLQPAIHLRFRAQECEVTGLRKATESGILDQ